VLAAGGDGAAGAYCCPFPLILLMTLLVDH
jgi:hypothetical protein